MSVHGHGHDHDHGHGFIDNVIYPLVLFAHPRQVPIPVTSRIEYPDPPWRIWTLLLKTVIKNLSFAKSLPINIYTFFNFL